MQGESDEEINRRAGGDAAREWTPDFLAARGEFEKMPSKGALFRAGIVDGLGIEYIHDTGDKWQVAVHAASLILFSEVGADIRYFLKHNGSRGYYVGSGVRVLNSPLLFDLALGYPR